MTHESFWSWLSPIFKDFDPSQKRDESGKWSETGAGRSSVTNKPYNEGKPYYRYGSPESPMSEWGHAMFLDNPSHLEGASRSGLANYEFAPEPGDPRVTSFEDVEGDIRSKLEDWEKNGVPEKYTGTSLETALDENSVDSLVSTFNPSDIVDSAQAYDNADFNQFLYDEILEPRGYGAIVTQDGSIVYDESMIKKVG